MRGRFSFIVLFCLIFVTSLAAQDESSSPYDIALERIREAEATGATRLELYGLGLNELPSEIGQLINLVYLDLSDNQLEDLPPEFGNLQNLAILRLYDNHFEHLPTALTNLRKLQILQIHSNFLEQLSPEIANLNNLWILSLDSNNLSELPSELWELENLVSFSLGNNQLAELSENISNLRKLCFLDLRGNQLKYLPTELGELAFLSSGTGCIDSALDFGLEVDNNPLISPPPEVVAQGTGAILAYLRNEATWHFNKLLIGGMSFVGIIAAIILGLRWRYYGNRVKKKKA